LFSALSTMTGSPGQATYTSSNSVLDSNSAWSRHARAHSAASGLMWGGVGYMGMRWKSFGSEEILARSEPMCRSIDLLTLCKYADANRIGRASLTHTQVLCYGMPRVQDKT